MKSDGLYQNAGGCPLEDLNRAHRQVAFWVIASALLLWTPGSVYATASLRSNPVPAAAGPV